MPFGKRASWQQVKQVRADSANSANSAQRLLAQCVGHAYALAATNAKPDIAIAQVDAELTLIVASDSAASAARRLQEWLGFYCLEALEPLLQTLEVSDGEVGGFVSAFVNLHSLLKTTDVDVRQLIMRILPFPV
mgnify:CR=1 FL=1